MNEVIKSHEKELKNLTNNSVLPFTINRTILALSSCKLSLEEIDVLKYGLKH